MAKENESDTNDLRIDGDAGAGGESEGRDAGADGVRGDDSDGEGGRDAGDTGETDPTKLKAAFLKRIAKLSASRQREREQYAADRARLAEYERREKAAQAALDNARRDTPEHQKAEARRRDVEAAIDDTAGPGATEWLRQAREREAAERDRFNEMLATDGVGYLAEDLTEHGVKLTDDKLARWERAIVSEFEADPALYRQFASPRSQKAAVQEATKRVRDGLVNPELKERNAKPLERIQRNRDAVLGGNRGGAVEGAPEPKFDLTPPKELKGDALDAWWREARVKAWDQLTASGE